MQKTLASLATIAVIALSAPVQVLAQATDNTAVPDVTSEIINHDSAPAPTCTLSASPSSISAGDSTTLTLSSTNAVSASIDNGAGSIDPNGTVSVSPSADTTYTVTVLNSDGHHATCHATVSVTAASHTHDGSLVDEHPAASCTLVSDDQHTYIGAQKATHTFTHSAWSTELNGDGAEWIWNAFHVTDPTQPETVTFTRTFNVSGSPSSAQLKIAADNSYTVSVNGNPVSGCDGSGFASVDTCTIPVVSGTNTITFTATNAATPDNSDPENNPAGLYYEVNVTDASCSDLLPPPPTSTVTLCKVSDVDGHPGLSGWGLNLSYLPYHPNLFHGTTTDNGCVTLDHHVPYGTYTAGEVAQEGWTFQSIMDGDSSVASTSVTVNSPTETFTLINHHDTTPPPPQSCVITSDTTTVEGGQPSFLVSFIHSSWTAVIAAASWIWGDDPVTDPVNGEPKVFTKTFTLASAPTATSTLMIAADNSYSVKVNDTAVGSDSGEFNYTADGQDSIDVPAADLHSGVNTLEFTVTNFPMADGTTHTNPAGLLYKLTIDGTSCTQDTPPHDSSIKVHIFKYQHNGNTVTQVPNDSGAPLFPMIATYNIAGVGSNLDPGDGYNLGDGGGAGGSDGGLLWAANTIPLHAGDTYGTHEVTGGNSPVVADSESCSPDKYYLEGYKTGDSLAAAQAAEISSTSPNYESISGNEYVIVVNHACSNDNGGGDTGATLTIVKDTTGGDGTFNFNVSDASAQVTTVGGVGTTTVDLADGQYDVTEAAQDGWTFDSVSCSYENEDVGTPISNDEHITISDGDNVTCTFHNTKNSDEVTPTTPTITHHHSRGGSGGGQVLGASTGQVLGNTCPLLTQYMRQGLNNDPAQVSLLETFLNGELGFNLAVNGFFDTSVTNAVNAFQLKYQPDVLAPWAPYGYSPTKPTGYVFKTTEWKINSIACPDLNAPFPQLP